jgi:hypothetical protein
MDIIPEVGPNVTEITNAEFVKLTIFNEYGNTANTNVYTFSSSYKAETIGNTVYDPLGGLLAVGAQNRDLRVTAGDTTIALSGVSGNSIFIVLDKKIRGSELEILRGFYDANMNLTNTYQRFTGIVTSYSIEEDREELEDTFTIQLNASSYKIVLENRIAGRKTNKESWRYFDSNDASMDQVYSIAGVQFDFGQDTKGKVTVPGYPGGAPGGPVDFNDFFNQNQR